MQDNQTQLLEEAATYFEKGEIIRGAETLLKAYYESGKSKEILGYFDEIFFKPNTSELERIYNINIVKVGSKSKQKLIEFKDLPYYVIPIEENLFYIYDKESNDIYSKDFTVTQLAVINFCTDENIEIDNDLILKMKYLSDDKIKLTSEEFPSISIVTFVYNSKEYIRECAESVLSQTLKNFEWVILDNGCTDGTSDILSEYASKDSRIKLFRNEKNVYSNPNLDESEKLGYDLFTEYRKNIKSEYVALLDSDDYLHKDFLKDSYFAAKKYDADMVISGTEMFDDKTGSTIQRRIPPKFNTTDITKVGDVFGEIYGSLRSMWGKLIKSSMYKTLFDKSQYNLLNGGDTYIILNFLKQSKNLISLNKALHYYRVRENSHYNSQVDKNRYLDYLIIYEEGKDILESWNKLSQKNIDFITQVLYFSMKDCIDVSLNTREALLGERIQAITTILSDLKLRKILNDRGILLNLIDEGLIAISTISEEK